MVQEAHWLPAYPASREGRGVAIIHANRTARGRLGCRRRQAGRQARRRGARAGRAALAGRGGGAPVWHVVQEVAEVQETQLAPQTPQ